MSIWIAFIGTFTGVLCVFIVINIINLKKMARLDRDYKPGIFPGISVIIPARNEEHNIAGCVYSLLNQDYPGCEVIVVNDNSTDNTYSILKSIKARFPALKIIQGKPLPSGWTGKNWACHQGSLAAKGDIYLFTDADTCHHPETLKRAVSVLLNAQADFLSALPAQTTGTFAEKSVIPLLFWTACSLFPFPLVNKIPFAQFSFGNGQFMMYKKSTYRKTGGYAAIKNNIFDDMTMARRIKKQGLKSVIADGSSCIRCRMYSSVREVFNGLTKNIFLLFHYTFPRYLSIPLYITALVFFGLVLFTPLFSLILFLCFFLFNVMLPLMIPVLSAAAVLLSYLTFSLVYVRFKFPLYMAFLYPLNGLFFIVIAFASLIYTKMKLTGWKGRKLNYEL